MMIIAAISGGVLTWTFLEYVIHRWMGHDRRFRRTPFGVEHIRHHVEGNYFAPTWKKLIVAAVVCGILIPPAVALVGVAAGIAYVAGLISFYGMYEWLHRREHTHPGFGAYGRFVRRHHFHHHFADGRTNHGVTTPIWDLVFGTYETPTIIKVPPKLCMAWLRDSATGGIRPEYAGTYQLRA
ncbi:MAG: sterol desaturase family protein [Proteobacteria bacterium]|nr:sterol desaturase family protein [Pseudomonadota bacterium]